MVIEKPRISRVAQWSLPAPFSFSTSGLSPEDRAKLTELEDKVSSAQALAQAAERLRAKELTALRSQLSEVSEGQQAEAQALAETQRAAEVHTIFLAPPLPPFLVLACVCARMCVCVTFDVKCPGPRYYRFFPLEKSNFSRFFIFCSLLLEAGSFG